MAVSKRTRYEVLRRDNFTCRYCRETEGKIVVDHVVPVALGGTDDPENLVAACHDCNAGKSSTSPTERTVEDVSNDAMRWAAAMKLAAEALQSRRGPLNRYIDAWADEWNSYQTGSHWTHPELPDGWLATIESFHKRGLPLSELTRALTVSMSKSHVHRSEKFRYMCGVGNSILREMAEEAQKILARDESTNG